VQISDSVTAAASASHVQYFGHFWARPFEQSFDERWNSFIMLEASDDMGWLVCDVEIRNLTVGAVHSRENFFGNDLY
jgi:hypothetical protein